MTEAVTAVVDWLFSIGRRSVAWESVVGNAASASVARKAGFSFISTGPALTAFRDGRHPKSWHALLRSEDNRMPKPGWPGSV
jgi:RimJ/RimL family protein N-acetyltransferase